MIWKCQATYAQTTFLDTEPPIASLGRVTLLHSSHCQGLDTPRVDIPPMPSASGNQGKQPSFRKICQLTWVLCSYWACHWSRVMPHTGAFSSFHIVDSLQVMPKWKCCSTQSWVLPWTCESMPTTCRQGLLCPLCSPSQNFPGLVLSTGAGTLRAFMHVFRNSVP